MGSGAPRGARTPSHIAYYVALAGIIGLLLLLCFYFLYYFIRKVKELSTLDTPTLQSPVIPRPQPTPSAYPVQPVVRDSATAMAKLCKQLPNQPGKCDTVFPTSTSPAAQQTDMCEGDDVRIPLPVQDKADKLPVPVAVTVIETAAAR